MHTAPPPSSATALPFSQAILVFNSHHLIESTKSAAVHVLNTPWEEGGVGKVPELSLRELLYGRQEEGNGREDEDKLREARGRLTELARRSEELGWGESVVLEYWVEGRSRKAEVLVAATSSSPVGEGHDVDEGFSILFLRPVTADTAATTTRSSLPSIEVGVSKLSLDTISNNNKPLPSASPLPSPAPRSPAASPSLLPPQHPSAQSTLSSSYPLPASAAPYSLPPDASAPADPVLSAIDVAKEMARYHNGFNAHRFRAPKDEEEARAATFPAVSVLEAGDAPAADEERDRRRPLPFQILSDLIETVPQIMFVADPTGVVLWFSDMFFTLTGLDPKYELGPEIWLNVFHAQDLPRVLKVYTAAMESGEDFWFDYRIKAKNGDWVWTRVNGRAHRDAEGVITNWMCGIVPIEELITARRNALLVKERLQSVLSGTALLLMTVDQDNTISLLEGRRPSFLCDLPESAIIGRPFRELFPSAELNEAVRKLLAGMSTVEEVEVTTSRDGEKHYHRYRLIPLHDDAALPSASSPPATPTHGVIIVGTDVTSLVQAEEKLEVVRSEKAQLRASELAATEANRLKTEFLTTVSHEIRTPIASMLGVCELLLADEVTGEQRQLIEKAVRSGENLLDLVGDVLDVRKVEKGELHLEHVPFKLSQVLADAGIFALTAQKKELQFVSSFEPYYEGFVLGDRLRLRQILANALSNAVKFTSEGFVSLRLFQREETDASVCVEFVIEDTGVGIDAAVLPTLFVPFRQADTSTARQFGGSGLGLTIARKLAELMGGTVTLASPGLGQGCTMTVKVSFNKTDGGDVDVSTLPAPPVPPKDFVEKKIEVIGEACRKPEEVKILLAEDNALIREIVTKTLKKMKFSIFAVNDGRECVEQVEKDDYDVILMDGQMPIMDGYAATAAIRKHSDPRIQNLRIIALTASAIAGDMERCLESGMDAYLAKPVRAKELEAAIWRQVDLIKAS